MLSTFAIRTIDMKKLKIAINGFGRIGRVTARVILQQEDMELVAVNDLTDNATLAHLFRYDSIHGKFQGSVTVNDHAILIGKQEILSLAEKDPGLLPWKSLGVDIVLECTGKFTTREGGNMHLRAGARKVILSAPAKGNDPVKTIVIGVNEQILAPEDLVVSNASCTTNNAAPMLKLLDENWGLEDTFVTTVHAYTGDQNIHDAPHKDLRRARAAAESIIPTTTGAAKALGDVMPHLKGRIGGAGIRVPVSDGSLTDITAVVNKSATVEKINQVFQNASVDSLKGIIEYTTDPLVSRDIIGNKASCVFDSQLTTVLGKMVKVVGWYDNEIGYSNRLVDLARLSGGYLS